MAIKNPVEVWTRLVSDPTMPGGLRADVPASVAYRANGGIVRDLLAPNAPVATGYVSVFVDSASKGLCPNLVDVAVVPEKDRLLVALVRIGNADKFDGAATEAFFGGLDMTSATREKQETVAALVAQAVARGMSAERAERIGATLGVLDVEVAQAK